MTMVVNAPLGDGQCAPLKEEPYTTTIDNYVSKIDFQLSRDINIPGDMYHDVMGNWAN